MNWLLNRLKEKSTWLAIFTLAGLFGMKIEPEFREAIINAILAIAAVVAFVFREDVKNQESNEHHQPRENDQLPPIDFVGRSERSAPPCDAVAEDDAPDFDTRFRRYRDPDDHQLRDELPTRNNNETHSGWNG